MPSVESGTIDERVTAIINSRAFRVVLATFGGYAFTSGYFALLSVALAQVGLSRAEAMWWGVLTSFVIYTGIVIWVAATTRPMLTSSLIVGGAAAMIVISPIFAPERGLV